MRKMISIILAASILLSSAACATDKGSTEYTNNEAVVMYRDGSIDTVAFESEEAFVEGVEKLREDENVVLVSPNYTYSADALSSSDAYADRQWALENDGSFYMEEQKNEHPVFDTPFGDAKLPGQWRRPDGFGHPGGRFRGFASQNTQTSATALAGIDVNYETAKELYKDSGKEIIIAIVDTGVDRTHEELAGKLWTNDDEIAANGIDDDGNGFVDDVYGWNFHDNTNEPFSREEDNHGTHGAGSIVAKSDNGIGISGLTNSDNIKVMSVKALGGEDGTGTTAAIIRAIQYAEKNGAVICNLSLGTSSHDEALYRVMENSNMLFVVAAGNNGEDTDVRPSYPSSYTLPNIISVANLNYDGNLHYSSNYGKNSVDIAAPGSYILSTTENNGYSYMTGTSMAAPMVSAAAALVYSHLGDEITLAGVKEILLSSAQKLTSLSDVTVSGGMLDIGAALSFDTSKLSYTDWEEKTPEMYKGKAPEISVSLVTSGTGSYLHISLYDEDGDAQKLMYAEGQYTAEYFISGNGTELALSESKTATLKPEPGTFTLFAEDKEGNSSVRIISVTDGGRSRREQRMRTPSHGGRMPTMPRFPSDEMFVSPGLAEELFREIANEFFGEFAPWFAGW